MVVENRVIESENRALRAGGLPDADHGDAALLVFLKSRAVLLNAAKKHERTLHLQVGQILLGKKSRIAETRRSYSSLLANAGMTSAATLVQMNVAPFDDLVIVELAGGGHAQMVLVLSLVRQATMALSSIASLRADDSPEDIELNAAFESYIGDAEKLCKKLHEVSR